MKTNKTIPDSFLDSVFKEFGYPVKLIQDPDDSSSFFVTLFGVPDEKEKATWKELNRFIVSKYPEKIGFFVASVEALSITRKHYPEMLPNPAFYAITSCKSTNPYCSIKVTSFKKDKVTSPRRRREMKTNESQFAVAA